MIRISRYSMKKIIGFLMKTLTTVDYEGVENIPQEGGVIVATNHLSRIDSGVLLLNPRRTDITALAADKYKKNLLLGFIMESVDVIWLDRDKADFAAFRAAIGLLRKGGALGIAPEGTRSKTGALAAGKPGATLLAFKANVPIVPVGVSGTEHAMREILSFKRPHLTAHFGKPIYAPSLERENRDEILQQFTDEIMCRIAALLPEKYRGFYAQHPRLKELLKDS